MAEKKQKELKTKEKNLAVALPTRGRIFEGYVVKKFPKRVVVEFIRTVYIKKYESFMKKKTRIHSRLPDNMDVNIGDYIQVQECRPLSKLIHSVVIKVIRKHEEKSQW